MNTQHKPKLIRQSQPMAIIACKAINSYSKTGRSEYLEIAESSAILALSEFNLNETNQGAY